MTFGEKLQSLRKSQGMSQEELAGKMTVSRQAISKWELNDTIPDTENVIQLSKLFHVTIDYLLNEEVETNEQPCKPVEHVNICEEAPKTKGIGTWQIAMIVFAIYMLAFAAGIMYKPKFLPFFAIIATAISILIVTIIFSKRRS